MGLAQRSQARWGMALCCTTWKGLTEPSRGDGPDPARQGEQGSPSRWIALQHVSLPSSVVGTLTGLFMTGLLGRQPECKGKGSSYACQPLAPCHGHLPLGLNFG